MKAEERWDCQAFVEAFRPSVPAHPRPGGHSCTPTTPDQQCATSHHSRDVSYCPATTMEDGGPAPAAPIPSVSEMPVPQVGTKCWHHSSDQGVPTLRLEEQETADLDDTPEEHPHHK